jgi:TPR repeat protein
MPRRSVIWARLRALSGRPAARLTLGELLAERGRRKPAMRHIAAAAHAGFPPAQTRLGLCYLRGHGVPASLTEACYWLEQAGNAGDASAQTELATLALGGVHGPFQRAVFDPRRDDSYEPDYQRAASLARRAADAGSAQAKALLALILRAAPATMGARDDPERLYQESAEAGWPAGQLGHAMTLLTRGSDEATREASGLLSSAADSGLPTAHFLLGVLEEAGAGIAQNLAAALTHYRFAAEHGHTGAKMRLGLALLAGRGGPRSVVEAESWLRRAANDGDAQSAAVLGDFYTDPERCPADLGEASRWYRRAAELGHPGAARVLAHTIAVGAAGVPDPNEIAAWLETAIERGEPAAWPELGGLIASLALPPEQLPALHEWLQRMIREAHPDAGFYVGVCVNNGIGTPVDARLARRYYLWAAGEGVIEAMVAAGEMLLNGRGGRADPVLARALFEYAAKRDHEGAIYALGVMAGEDREGAMRHFRRAAGLGHAKSREMVA